MIEKTIEEIVLKQKFFFKTGETKAFEYRISQIEKLKKLVMDSEKELSDAIKKDLGRCEIDSFIGDLMSLNKAFDYTIKNLKRWMKPENVKSMFGTKSFILSEPMGCVLVISPWNYPALLAFEPLLAAISAGNCAIVKPSEITPNVSRVIKNIINENFDEKFIKVIEGGIFETSILLKQKFDHIFFTGSTTVGKIVYEAASKNLIPVTLELGGKSPVIVDSDVDMKIAARRIIWGKLLNNGQTCVAPDYLFVQKSIKNKFVEALIDAIKDFYGEDAQKSPYYSRIVNEANFNRLKTYLENQKIIYGGNSDSSDLFISPTLLESPDYSSLVMKNEIFGPILPIFEYENVEDVISCISNGEKPLAMYIFTKRKSFYANVINNTSSGGVSINDVIMHISSEFLPFGGVGASGIGRYHGKFGFDTFSNKRSVLKNTYLFDRDIMYPPYKLTLEQIKKISKLF